MIVHVRRIHDYLRPELIVAYLRVHHHTRVFPCPAVIVAAHAGMTVLGLSLITNRCVAPDDTETVPPTHEEVLEVTNARYVYCYYLCNY